MSTWVVVADSRRARIFAAGKKLSELSELQDFVHPAIKDNTGGDPRGRGGDGHGTGVHHGLEAKTSVKEHDLNGFAHELGQFLQKEFSQRHFSELVLVAAPELLGALRKALDAHVQLVVKDSINKDFTRYSREEVEAYFKKEQAFS